MKKILCVFLCLICLCGCSKVQGDVQGDLDQRLTAAENRSSDAANYNHGLYSYYCPSDIGRMESTELGNVFRMDGVQFAMNLNVCAMINNIYYQQEPVSNVLSGQEVVADHAGSYVDHAGVEHSYSVQIVRCSERTLVTFDSDVVQFLGSGNELECSLMAAQMLRIARSVKVDLASVTAAYSNRQMITYVRKKVDLFQNVAPESGAIEELFDTGHETIEEVGTDYNGDNFGPAQKPMPTENPDQESLDEIKANSH